MKLELGLVTIHYRSNNGNLAYFVGVLFLLTILYNLSVQQNVFSEGLTPESSMFSTIEIENIQNGAENFKAYFETLSLRDKHRLFMEFEGSAGMAMINMFLGLKPAMTIDLSGPVFFEIPEQFPEFKVIKRFLCNMAFITRVIHQNPDIFDDYDTEWDSTAEPLPSQLVNAFPGLQTMGELSRFTYLSRVLDAAVRGEKNLLKLGLLLGYPPKAVEKYSKGLLDEDNSKGYDGFGVQFSYDAEDHLDVSDWHNRYKAAYQVAGIDEFIVKTKDQLSTQPIL